MNDLGMVDEHGRLIQVVNRYVVMHAGKSGYRKRTVQMRVVKDLRRTRSRDAPKL